MSKCGAMAETYGEIKRERHRERGHANVCHLSPAAGLAVWHVWWMVLHWYCCPLTSTHCHQSKDKGVEEHEGKNPAARAVGASFHQDTRTYTDIIAYTPSLPSSSTNTLVQTSKHSHTCTLTPTLISCIILQRVFAEQSWFCSAWLTSFRSLQTDHVHQLFDATITQLEESTGWSMQRNTDNCICAAHSGRGEKWGGVEECTLLNSWEKKDGTGKGKLLCWQGAEQSLLVLPPRHRWRKRCEMGAVPASSALMGLFKGWG